MIKLIYLFVALLIGCNAFAADVRVSIPNHDDLVFNVPDNWKAQIRSPRPDLPPTITITSAKRGEHEILITPIWPANSSISSPTSTDIRKLVQGAADSVKSQAAEKSLKLLELNAAGKVGFYFTATDRAPKPGEYKYMTQGAVGFNELNVTFTILVNDESLSVTEQALQVLKTMRRVPRKDAT